MLESKIIFLVSKIDNQPQSYFFEYLSKINKEFYIFVISNNSLENKKNYYSFEIRLFKNKKLIKKKKVELSGIFFNDMVNQILNFFHTIYYLNNFLKKFKNKNSIIFSENLKLTFIANKFKNFFLFKKINFFNGDILPEDIKTSYFQSGNFIFRKIKNFTFVFLTHYIKRQCLKNSDLIIYSSDLVKKWDIKKFKINFRSVLIENPHNYEMCKKFSKFRSFNFNFLYFGNLNINNGINEMIEISKLLNAKNINFFFTIVGGSKKIISKYKIIINNLGLSKFFKFMGRVEDLSSIDIQRHQSFGIAPYFFNSPKLFSHVDNGKINDYINFCLPIITTSYPLKSDDIKEFDLGLISNNVNDILNFLLDLNKTKYNLFINNLLKYSKKKSHINFLKDYEKIFEF